MIPTLTMNTGAHIPTLGFGTYKVEPANAVEIVSEAIDLGYRHIDTAQMYGNEAEVGEAIASSAVPRDEIFLTTKLNNSNHLPDDARRSFDQSLVDLKTDYVDLFLIHWPLPTLYGGDFLTTWKVLEEFYADGRAKAIGVSNFLPEHLEVILRGSDVVPAINQIEVHPYFTNEESRAANDKAGILTQAWSPLGRGVVLGDETIGEIATRHSATPAQVILAWHIARGDIVFPKSVTPERIKENMDIFDISLSAEEVETISNLDRGEEGRTGSHPSTMARL